MAKYYTNCGKKNCTKDIHVTTLQDDLTREQICVIFLRDYGWELFPSRCPEHRQKDEENEQFFGKAHPLFKRD